MLANTGENNDNIGSDSSFSSILNKFDDFCIKVNSEEVIDEGSLNFQNKFVFAQNKKSIYERAYDKDFDDTVDSIVETNSFKVESCLGDIRRFTFDEPSLNLKNCERHKFLSQSNLLLQSNYQQALVFSNQYCNSFQSQPQITSYFPIKQSQNQLFHPVQTQQYKTLQQNPILTMSQIIVSLTEVTQSKLLVDYNYYSKFLKGKLYYLISNKNTSKLMQKIACQIEPSTLTEVIKEIITFFIFSLQNDFCNYFYQKLFKYISQGERILILSYFKNQLPNICLLHTGVYVIISLIDKATTIEEIG